MRGRKREKERDGERWRERERILIGLITPHTGSHFSVLRSSLML